VQLLLNPLREGLPTIRPETVPSISAAITDYLSYIYGQTVVGPPSHAPHCADAVIAFRTFQPRFLQQHKISGDSATLETSAGRDSQGLREIQLGDYIQVLKVPSQPSGDEISPASFRVIKRLRADSSGSDRGRHPEAEPQLQRGSSSRWERRAQASCAP